MRTFLCTLAIVLLAFPCSANPLTLPTPSLLAVYEYRETPTMSGHFWEQTKATYASMPQVPIANLIDGDLNTMEIMHPWNNVSIGGNGFPNPPIFFYRFSIDPAWVGQATKFTWFGLMNSTYTGGFTQQNIAVWSNGAFRSQTSINGLGAVSASLVFMFESTMIENNELWLAARAVGPSLPSGALAPTVIFNSEITLEPTLESPTPFPTPEPSSLLLLGLGLAGTTALKRHQTQKTIDAIAKI